MCKTIVDSAWPPACKNNCSLYHLGSSPRPTLHPFFPFFQPSFIFPAFRSRRLHPFFSCPKRIRTGFFVPFGAQLKKADRRSFFRFGAMHPFVATLFIIYLLSSAFIIYAYPPPFPPFTNYLLLFPPLATRAAQRRFFRLFLSSSANFPFTLWRR